VGRAGSGPEFHVNFGSGRVHFTFGSGSVGSRKLDSRPTLFRRVKPPPQKRELYAMAMFFYWSVCLSAESDPAFEFTFPD